MNGESSSRIVDPLRTRDRTPGEAGDSITRPSSTESNGQYETPPPETAPSPGERRFDRLGSPTEQPPFAAGATSTTSFPHIPGYEILAELGRGGMGVVYRARHVALKRIVALKMLLPGVAATGSLRDRFRTESEAAARLQHPNIVRVYEVGEVEGQPFLVMESVDGGSLAGLLASGPMRATPAAAVVAALARAADYAHRCGVVHRDLKPANVLLEVGDSASPGAIELATDLHSGRMTPKISDFGLAKQLDADSNLTQTGAILGTPCYMAPEQAGGECRRAGPAVDVYALGVILYEALTGHLPFRAATALETLDLVRNAEPPPPEHYQPNLPRDLRTICLKCLEKQPARRYASSADLAADLERFGLGVPILARPVGTFEHAARWAKRRPTAAALVGVCVLALGGSLVGLLVHNDRLRGEVERTQLQEIETRREKAAALDHVRRGHAALDDIFTSLENTPVGVAGSAAFRAMYEEQAQAILRFYRDTLEAGDEADPEIRYCRGMVSVYAGRMQQRLGQSAAAETDYRRGCDYLKPLAERPDARLPHRQEFAHGSYWLGTLLQQTGRHEAAAESYARAAAEAAALESEGTAGDRERRVLALSHYRLAEIDWLGGRAASAERHAREAVTRWDRMIDADPENEIHRLWALKALHTLALVYLLSQNEAELDAVAQRAAAAMAWYDGHPLRRKAGLLGRIELSEVYRHLAHGLPARGETRAAVDRITHAIRLGETVLEAEPPTADHRAMTAALYRDRAMFRIIVGLLPEAFRDLDRAIALAEGTARLTYRIERAFGRVENGEVTAAGDELTEVAADESLSAAQAAEVGRVFAHVVAALGNDAALAPDDRTRRQDDSATKAFASIRRAVEKGGFRDIDEFRQYRSNPVIADVRARPGFDGRFDELEKQIAARRAK